MEEYHLLLQKEFKEVNIEAKRKEEVG